MSQAHYPFKTKSISLKNGLSLWTESFGNPAHTPLLLISGAGSQCRFWPNQFCSLLSDKGYFVIRYDHRDTGQSSAVDYQAMPYTVMDLSQDAVSVLEHYEIHAAHIVGFSMGGQIAQFLGAYFPQHVRSLTLMGTSPSFEEGFMSFFGKTLEGGLSQPKPDYVKWATALVDFNQMNLDEKIAHYMKSKQILNGDKIPYDTELWLEIGKESCTRTTLFNPYLNHAQAMQASFDAHREAPAKIQLPTLIVHGTEDPIFGVDHGHALQKAILGSRLLLLDGMGHTVNSRFWDQYIDHIHALTQINQCVSF